MKENGNNVQPPRESTRRVLRGLPLTRQIWEMGCRGWVVIQKSTYFEILAVGDSTTGGFMKTKKSTYRERDTG